MNLRSLLMVMCCVIFCGACSHGSNTDVECKRVELDLDAVKIEDESIFSACTLLQLEVTEQSLLGDISKVMMDENQIYVLSMMEPTLFVFDRSGKFRFKLKRGQGPGEILFVSDIAMKGDSLFVLDNYRVIKAYGKDGSYLGDRMKLESPYFSMYMTKNGICLMDPNIGKRSDHILHVFTQNGEELYLPKNEWLRDVSFTTYSAMRDGYIVWPLSDRIYRIDQETSRVVPAYWVDFKGKWIGEQEFKEKMKNKDMCGGRLDKYARWLKDVVALPDGGLFFAFKYDKDYYVKCTAGIPSVYEHLLEGFPDMRSSSVGSYGDKLIYVYSPDALKSYRDEHPGGRLSSLEWLDGHVEDLNPVLCLIPVK